MADRPLTVEPIPDYGGATLDHGAVHLPVGRRPADSGDPIVARACFLTGQGSALD